MNRLRPDTSARGASAPLPVPEADQWLADELELALWTARVLGCVEVTT
jgi:hypothetical protein